MREMMHFVTEILFNHSKLQLYSRFLQLKAILFEWYSEHVISGNYFLKERRKINLIHLSFWGDDKL